MTSLLDVRIRDMAVPSVEIKVAPEDDGGIR